MKPYLITLSAITFLIFAGPTYIDSIIFFFFLPLVVISILKDKPRTYGIRIGKLSTGLFLTFLGIIISVVVTYLGSKYSGSIIAYYSTKEFNLFFVIRTMIYIIGWEFLFRGYLLFGLAKHWGKITSNIIQTLLFFITHIGKPTIEL